MSSYKQQKPNKNFNVHHNKKSNSAHLVISFLYIFNIMFTKGVIQVCMHQNNELKNKHFHVFDTGKIKSIFFSSW